MGAWGHGILENDRALEEFSDTYDELICRLMRAVDPRENNEWSQMADAKVLAHLVGLIASSHPNYGMYTRRNASEWRDSAEAILSRNLCETYKAEESEIEANIALLHASFERVIDYAASEDEDHGSDAANDRYAIWLRIQHEIEKKINRDALAEEVLRIRNSGKQPD